MPDWGPVHGLKSGTQGRDDRFGKRLGAGFSCDWFGAMILRADGEAKAQLRKANCKHEAAFIFWRYQDWRWKDGVDAGSC